MCRRRNNGETLSYDDMLRGRKGADILGFGIFAEIIFEGDLRVCFNDGVNVRSFRQGDKIPGNYDNDHTCFFGLLDSAKPNLSAKAFLATKQRIPGLGNGVLQDSAGKAQ